MPAPAYGTAAYRQELCARAAGSTRRKPQRSPAPCVRAEEVALHPGGRIILCYAGEALEDLPLADRQFVAGMFAALGAHRERSRSWPATS
jgi:hypothetical protein